MSNSRPDQSPPPDGGFSLVPRHRGDGTFDDFEVTEAHGIVPQLLHRSLEQIVGQPLRAIFPIPRVEEFINGFRQVLASGVAREMEYPILFGTIDATWIWQRATPVAGTLVVDIRDLTAQRRAEVRQAAADQQFDILFKHSPLPIILHAPDGRITDANQAFATLVGDTRQSIETKRIQEFLDEPVGIPASGEPVRRLLTLADESRHPVVLHIDQLPHGYSLVAIRDVSANEELERVRTHSDLALRESEARFRSAFEQAGNGMALLSPAGQVIGVNLALASMLGYDLDAAHALTWRDVLHPDEHDSVAINLARVSRGEAESTRAERRGVHRDGSTVWMQVTVSGVRTGTGAPAHLLAHIEDITERKRLSAALRDSEEQLRLALTVTRDGIWDYRIPEGRSYTSPVFRTMLGYAPDLGFTQDDFIALVHPDDRQRVVDTQQRHITVPQMDPYDIEFRILRADGGYAWIRSRGQVVERDPRGQALRMIGTHSDVSERRILEEQFRQAQKMEAVGKLAGGVAHDFNNLLTTITATTELLMQDLRPDDPHRDDVLDIALAADRAKTLTRQLLSFSRQEVERLVVVELDAVVERVRPLLQRLVAAEQQLVVQATAPNAWVECDPGQFELALLNLVANARDAMPDGGAVTVRTDVVVLRPDDLLALPQLSPGRFVTVSVRDTGLGMSEEVQRHLFEPFFTTKPQGKGTGLGLAIIYGFIERMHGAVLVRSAPNEGSSFTLYLPAVAVPSVSRHDTPATTRAVSRGQERRVLIVDDEATLRRTTRRLLERKGYQVVEAGNADEAIAVLDAAPVGSIHIVLTDQAMPGRTGRQLVQEVSMRFPDIRSILMSGYTGDHAVRKALGGSDGETTFLPKPFTIDELTAALEA
ncbi:MAG: PAS domain S-box protein [Gemmatimonadota bacterium]